LTSIIDECLSETLKDYQLSPGSDDQRDINDGSSARDAGGASAYVQGAGNDLYSDDSLEYVLGVGPGYDGNVQDPIPKAVSFGVPELVPDLNSGYGSGVGDPFFLGAAAFGVSESRVWPDAGNEGG
jgi:hypothetical protein